MNVVFDQGTPRPLRSYRPDHTVHTRYELGWSELQNGLILGRAEADGYDLFINTDQNIQHQQKLARGGISVIFLMNTNRIQATRPEENADHGASPIEYRDIYLGSVDK